jgi:hypothetical protein
MPDQTRLDATTEYMPSKGWQDGAVSNERCMAKSVAKSLLQLRLYQMERKNKKG